MACPRPLRNCGFTLIEISIVLVIVGLIIGGILVGQDLIMAAKIQSQIAQIDKYRAAVNTFHVKYGALPGDIKPANATGFGFAARDGTPGQGDEDKLIGTWGQEALYAIYQSDPLILDSYYAYAGGENTLIWRDLSDAQLIDGGFTTATEARVASWTANSAVQYFPRAKIDGGYIVAYSDLHPETACIGPDTGAELCPWPYRNVFILTGIGISGQPEIPIQNLVTPAVAMNIDTKIDDGKPLTGAVKSYSPRPSFTKPTFISVLQDPNYCNDDAVPPFSGIYPQYGQPGWDPTGYYLPLNNRALCLISFRF